MLSWLDKSHPVAGLQHPLDAMVGGTLARQVCVTEEVLHHEGCEAAWTT